MMIARQTSLLLIAGLLAVGCTPEKRDLKAASTANLPQKVYRTGVLKAEPGHIGDVYGAEVGRISILPDDVVQAIEITLPIEPHRVDQVEVVSTSGNPVEQVQAPEITPGDKGDNTRVKIFLPKREKWQFRLRLIDNLSDQ